MIWKLLDVPDREIVGRLARELSTEQPFPLAVAEVLVRRNIQSYQQARTFFVPRPTDMHDPFLMAGMEDAVMRILEARTAGEKILLLGDYDVDGTTAVTLLSLFLADWGIEFEYYIPDRYKEGYGVSYQGIDFAIANGVKLIISLDCGIKAVDKVKYANLKGIDFIICDHHTPGPELPPALAILDPRREDCAYPDKNLTGCGVGLKLIQALTSRMIAAGDPPPVPNYDPLAAYADLVCLSIACDIVPIVGENRVIAFRGLQKLQTDPLPGIKILMDQAEGTRDWDISDLVFFLGPRINSAGRLGHASKAVEVLMGKHRDLKGLADGLQASNTARQDLDRQITEEALELIAEDSQYSQRATTVLYRPEWHKGVIGIVASRLIEHHYRPTVLLTESDGKLVGSARSVAGFDLYQALDACADHLIQFGGHRYAAGLTLKAEAFPAFRDHFDQIVGERLLPDQKIPVIYVESELTLDQIDARFVRLLNRLSPFGPSNRRPVFISNNVKVLHAKILKDRHVKFTFEQSGCMIEGIGFNQADTWRDMGENGPLDIAYQPIFNTWNRKTRINLRLKDIKSSHEGNAV